MWLKNAKISREFLKSFSRETGNESWEISREFPGNRPRPKTTSILFEIQKSIMYFFVEENLAHLFEECFEAYIPSPLLLKVQSQKNSSTNDATL